ASEEGPNPGPVEHITRADSEAGRANTAHSGYGEIMTVCRFAGWHTMRPIWLGLLGLLLLAGCSWPWFSRSPTPPAGTDPYCALGGPAGSDVVVMEVAVLEMNIGDKYLNEELWNTTIEQSLPPETRTILEENGLRAGLIAGQPPDFLQVITSERTN